MKRWEQGAQLPTDHIRIQEVAIRLRELEAQHSHDATTPEPGFDPTHFGTPEVLYVRLDNNDQAVYVNQQVVLYAEAWEKSVDILDLGKSLADALGVELVECDQPTPTHDEWDWSDVYKELKGQAPAAPAQERQR